ncbi:MAG: P22 phage major capsid protein family protein [Halanaerobiales bacterium]
MANEFLSMKRIAREALPILVDNLVAPNLFYQNYSNDFANVGDTIQVKKPPIFEAKSFDQSSGVDVQDVKTSRVDVTMDQLDDVSVEVTSKELALDIDDFNNEVTEPAAVALAEKINKSGLKLYKDIPYFAGTAGSTPDSLADLANIRRILNENQVPTNMRRVIWDTYADAELTQVDALVHAEKADSPRALREAQIGRVYGLENYFSQAVAVHEAGTYTENDDIQADGSASAGDETIDLVSSTSDTAGGGDTLVEGDVFTLNNDKYTVTSEEETADSDGKITVSIYPALQSDVADGDEADFETDHTANLGFHRNAFAFVSRSLPLPSDKDAYTVSYNGITLRAVYGYDMKYKKNMLSFDILYGYKTLYPELAVRYLG